MKENTDPLLYQAKLTAVILRMFCFINYFCIKVFSCAIHYFVFYFCYLSFLPPSSLLLLPSFFSSFLIISLSFLKQTNENIKTKQNKKRSLPHKKAGFIFQYTEGKKYQGSKSQINVSAIKLITEFEITACKGLMACMMRKVYWMYLKVLGIKSDS